MKKPLIILIIILIGLTALMLWTGHAAIAALIGILIVLFIIGIIMNILSAKKTDVDVDIIDNSIKGDDLIVVIKIINRSKVPVFKGHIKIDVKNENFDIRAKKEFTFSVAGNSQREIQYVIKSEYCGLYKVFVKEVRNFDIWGITSKLVEKEKEYSGYMYPKYETIKKVTEILKVSYEKEKKFLGRKNSNLSETLQYRDYIEGDSLKNINWKLSNKFDQLIVREFDTPIDNQLLVVLDINAGKPEYQNLAYSVMFSISMSYVLHNMTHQLGWEKEDKTFEITEISKETELLTVMKDILSVPIDQAQSAMKPLVKNEHPEKYAKIIFITNTITEEVLKYSKMVDNLLLIPVDEKHFDINNSREELKKINI